MWVVRVLSWPMAVGFWYYSTGTGTHVLYLGPLGFMEAEPSSSLTIASMWDTPL